MFQGVGGAQALYVGKYMALSDVEGNFNRSKEIMNAWSPSNTGSNIPRLSKNDPNSNFSTPSDWYLENASYLRLKNIEIGYSLPQKLIQKAHLQQVRFYVQGMNLLTFDKLGDVNMDPETGNGNGSWYPIQRIYNFGVNVTF